MKHLTVSKMRDLLDELIAKGMGDRAVAFPIIDYDEGYDGDYVLVKEVDPRDCLEIAVYLRPLDDTTDCQEWDELEDLKWGEMEEEDWRFWRSCSHRGQPCPGG